MKAPICLLSLCLALLPLASPAQTWNRAYGMGNASDAWSFSGSGVPYGVVANVLSNNVYYITSAKASGDPLIDRVLLKSDLAAGTLDFYAANTNTYTVASNGVMIGSASTNVIWLQGTNAGLATNDLLVYQSIGSDDYQLTVLGGGSTTASGLVATNSLGQCAVKIWNGLTNAPATGDIIYRMTRILRVNPLAENTITNKVLTPSSSWLNLNDLTGGSAQPLNLKAQQGTPTLLINTYGTSGSLFVSGEYFVRPRR